MYVRSSGFYPDTFGKCASCQARVSFSSFISPDLGTNNTERTMIFYGLVESYRSIVEHRRKFINLRDFDYDTLYPDTLSILPPASVDDLWRKDYENMQKTMIYGNSPSYEQLLKLLAELQKEIKMLPYQP